VDLTETSWEGYWEQYGFTKSNYL